MHAGAVEQRWAEVAWACAANANAHRTTREDPVAQPKDYNPLRLAEAVATNAGIGRPSSGRRGLPLDPETIRAYHAALTARAKATRGVGKVP